MKTRDKILLTTQKIFSRQGPEGINIRTIAGQLRIAPSVIYHHFENKDKLIEEMYEATWQALKTDLAQLPFEKSLSQNMKNYLHFSFDHAQEYSTLLKYFEYYRILFRRHTFGYLPNKYFGFIEKSLEYAITEKQLTNFDTKTIARQIGHTYYGYLREYFPSKVTEEQRKVLFEMLTNIALQILEPYEVGS